MMVARVKLEIETKYKINGIAMSHALRLDIFWSSCNNCCDDQNLLVSKFVCGCLPAFKEGGVFNNVVAIIATANLPQPGQT